MPSYSLKVNGEDVTVTIENRTLLVHLGLTGTHVGCDTTQCGACVVHMNGRAVKSCTVLAAQAQGTEITTIEGVEEDGRFHPVQAAFKEHHGLQCGFCTPGMVMTAIDMIRRNPGLNRDRIRSELKGNICRCTGYQNIVDAVAAAAEALGGQSMGDKP